MPHMMGRGALNFVNFLRNVGAARDTHHGGGTYGYGKSSLYAMSSCSTVVVDSQTRCGGREERRVRRVIWAPRLTPRRMMGNVAALPVVTGGACMLEGADSIEPARNENAIAVSTALGMPRRDATQTGTSILIIDPILGDEGMRATIDDVVETVLWNFWPRMAASTPECRKLKVEVELDGEKVPVPAPEEFPPLDLFAAAMAEHRSKGMTCSRSAVIARKSILATWSFERDCVPTDADPPFAILAYSEAIEPYRIDATCRARRQISRR